jgi:hypothetical protein
VILILFSERAKERKEIRRSKRKLDNEEVPNVSFPQNVITIIISARMRWAGHVTRIKEMRLVGVLGGKISGKM